MIWNASFYSLSGIEIGKAVGLHPKPTFDKSIFQTT